MLGPNFAARGGPVLTPTSPSPHPPADKSAGWFIFTHVLTGERHLLLLLTVSFNHLSPYTSCAAAHWSL